MNRRYRFNNLFMLRYLFQKSPGYVLGYFLYGLMIALPNVVCNVLVYKLVIDAVTMGSGLGRILWILAFTAAFLLSSDLYNAFFSEIVMRRAKERLQNAIFKEVLEKAAEMDLASYDRKDFYDRVILAMDSSYVKAQEALECLVDILSACVNILFSLSVFLLVGREILVIIVLSILATFVWNRPLARQEKGKREEAVPEERKQSYLRRVFYLREYAKELRLSQGIPALLFRCYDQAVVRLTSVFQRWNRKKAAYAFLQSFLADNLLLQFVLTAFLLYSALVKKSITLGDFVAVFNGIHVTVSMVNYLIGSTFTRLKTNGLFIEKFRAFLSSKPSIRSGGLLQAPQDRTLTLDKVGFTYPGNDADTLQSVSFSIKPGEKIALVGYNGAGKTTLVHLLLRLYDVTQGSVDWGGQPAQGYDLSLLRSQFGVLFQHFQIYAVTLAENVAMDPQWDGERMAGALDQSGLGPLVRRLPLGEQTPVLREFDEKGLMLSGGEQQKLAIARIFYTLAPVLILDEPSSALDPLAEYELNRRIQSLAADKTVLFISHRLSTVRMADRILLLDKGRIVEEGSHHQLLALKGDYWRLWNLQAEKYKDCSEQASRT